MQRVRRCLTLIIALMIEVPLCFAVDAIEPVDQEVAPQDSKRHRTKRDLLGRGHLWLAVDRVDFTGATQDVWGVDTDRYFGLAGWWGGRSNVYAGIELGRVSIGTTRTEDGELIENFAFTSGEFNFKKLFGLAEGLGLGLGAGGALFFASGEEVDAFGRSDLADFGCGYQGFVEFDFRYRRFVIGFDAKYQAAIDFLGIDYSNFRLGPHIGVVF